MEKSDYGNSTISDKYTLEPVRNSVKIGRNDMSLDFKIVNNTSKDIGMSFYFDLEYKIGEQWYAIPPKDYFFVDLIKIIEPNKPAEYQMTK